MEFLILSEAEVKRLLDLDDMLEALAEGFKALTSGQVCAPPRNEVSVPAGFLFGMPAHLRGDNIAVKLVSVFHGNHRLGIPGHQALICLFDSEIEKGRLFVETRLAFEPTPVGCDELKGLNPEIGTEVGEVLLDLRPGRQSANELTVYKSMGHAVEDTVTANLVYKRAKKEGTGIVVNL